jgi:hypothetical protein
LNGVSENPRGCRDPNPEGEHLQKDSRKNGNGSRQVASPTKAVPCGNECRKSKTKRCHEDHEKQVARKNQNRVRQLPKRLGYSHIFGCCCLRSAATPDLFRPDRRIAARAAPDGFGPRRLIVLLGRRRAKLPPSGGLLWHIRFAGPVFRFGQNPALGFCFGLEVSDMRVRAISRRYGNEPTAAFYHFGFKIGDRLSHCRNMRR